MDVVYNPIGTIFSPFTTLENMPIQPSGAKRVRGRIQIDPLYAEGLADLEGFSHVILLYHFHLVQGYKLTVTPFLDDQSHGVFATRAPKRPNPIGLSIVRLLQREDLILYIENVDILDQTPLLDIKPYVPEFDWYQVEKTGWLEKNKDKVEKKRSDRRFQE